MAPSAVRQVLSAFFEYDTPRIVHIKSKKVGIINRFLQLCIIGYVIGYHLPGKCTYMIINFGIILCEHRTFLPNLKEKVTNGVQFSRYAIVWKKGYQQFDSVRSSVTTKVKGVVRVEVNGRAEVMDVADYVIPPQENGALFVMTNLIRTDNQTQSVCTEAAGTPGVACTNHSDCPANTEVFRGNGIRTGTCDLKMGRCEIYAWCPVEEGERPREPLFKGAENFTVFVKNNVEFHRFNVKKRNLPSNSTDKHLTMCAFNHDIADSSCPIFTLGTIVNATGNTFNSIAGEGGVIEMVIDWDCDLDHSLDKCVPKYDFRRIDSPQYKIAKGYNFRFATYHECHNGETCRTLTKAYGIYFIINVLGRAGKFSVVPLLLNIGSGMALLVIATIVSDVVLLYVLKSRTFFKRKKYLTVTGSDAYQIYEDDHNPDIDDSSHESRADTHKSH